MNNNADAGLNKPFLLYPAAKDYLWGGSRLNDDFGKNIPLSSFVTTVFYKRSAERLRLP